jgi:hypothetical protein
MTKSQAEAILALVNSKEWARYMDYKKERLNRCYENLEWEDENIKKLQGQIIEIKNDLTLHEEVANYLNI